MKLTAALAAVCVYVALQAATLADDAVMPGELIVEPPTLICLGFEWRAVGVAIEVAELLDADGKPLRRAVELKGLRIISQPSGMDLLCVCAVAP